MRKCSFCGNEIILFSDLKRKMKEYLNRKNQLNKTNEGRHLCGKITYEGSNLVNWTQNTVYWEESSRSNIPKRYVTFKSGQVPKTAALMFMHLPHSLHHSPCWVHKISIPNQLELWNCTKVGRISPNFSRRGSYKWGVGPHTRQKHLLQNTTMPNDILFSCVINLNIISQHNE